MVSWSRTVRSSRRRSCGQFVTSSGTLWRWCNPLRTGPCSRAFLTAPDHKPRSNCESNIRYLIIDKYEYVLVHEKVQVGLWDHHAVCMSLIPGIWAHPNGVLHKYLPSFRACTSSPISLPGNGSAQTLSQQEKNWRRILHRSDNHIIVIAKQWFSYFCSRVGKFKCFKPTFHI
jgi:hypothetical protein